jgi:hypothetical protein
LTAKDPILFGGDGPNVYSYALNGPINAFDATGLVEADAVSTLGGTSLGVNLARIALPSAASIIRPVVLTLLPWLSWEFYVHYAKGGPQNNPTNYVLDDARVAQMTDPDHRGQSICEILRRWMVDALASGGSSKYINDIDQAMKFAGCKGNTYSNSK